MKADRVRSVVSAGLLLPCLLAAGCAINPATGKRQFMLVSESQEIALGREADKSISAQMGLYDDDAMQEYVQKLGHDLAARSERPELGWTFRVVDDPVINAFALPGGYIYITRGILAHMNSEAELASVVGHEIGHVTARHGASQMSKSQALGLGMTATAILAPGQMSRFGDLAQTGLGLIFLKYGRDDERQADDLGLRYMVIGGYDPRPMADMFDMLDRVGQASGGGAVPGWMSTHPTPGNRRQRADDKIASMNRDFSGWTVDREGFLDRIDGLTFGEDPRQGYFEDSRFNHPEMRFRMDFPSGWVTQNMRQAVVGQSPEKDAVLTLTLSSAETPEAALDEFFSGAGLRRTGPSMGSISGLRTAGDGFSAETEQGTLQGRVGFVSYGGRVFQLLGFSAGYRWPHYEPDIRRALASFDKLEDRRALEVQPRRLTIVKADRTEPLERFAGRHDATAPLETLALINRLDPGAAVRAGQSYKLVTGGRLP